MQDYRYPPLYKYVAFLIIVFLFMKYYRVIKCENYLLIAVLFTTLVMALDFILIENHPELLYDRTEKTDLENIIDLDNETETEDPPSTKMRAPMKTFSHPRLQLVRQQERDNNYEYENSDDYYF